MESYNHQEGLSDNIVVRDCPLLLDRLLRLDKVLGTAVKECSEVQDLLIGGDSQCLERSLNDLVFLGRLGKCLSDGILEFASSPDNGALTRL